MSGFDQAEARAVTKIFGRQRALYKVSLKLKAGQITALMGPNGAGKSTLLWLFSTLSTPSSGSMHFGQLPPARAKEARGHIGLVSHAALSYGELSALENLRFFAELYGHPSPEAAALALLEDFGLKAAMHRPAATFSRGMLQRLGLARAMISKPSLLLLDEPFTGLDRSSRGRVRERVAALAEAGAIVLMVSHDLETSAALADVQAILVRGRLAHRAEGRLSPAALREQYAEVTEAAR